MVKYTKEEQDEINRLKKEEPLDPETKKKAQKAMKKLQDEGECYAEEMINKITRKVTLKNLHASTEPCNFEILNMLPATTEEISNRFDWGVSQLYKRLSKLEELGLVTRGKEFRRTELGDANIGLILMLEQNIKKILPELV